MSEYIIIFARSSRKEREYLDEKMVNRIFPELKI